MQYNKRGVINDRHNIMINTRKHIVLSTLLFIITIYLANNSFTLFCEDNSSITEQQFDLALPSTENGSYRKRMRKPKTKNKTKKITTYLDMDYEQLVAAKDIQKAKGNTSATIKYLEQLLKMCTDITLLAQHLLELADTFFIDGQFKKAAFIYNQYCALYPGSSQQEYALYRSIISSFACILSIDRDQTKTEETLALCELFLQQDHFTTYKIDVAQIQTKCHEQLAMSECNICSFYIQKGNIKAAEKRLARMRTFWLPKLSTLEPNIIALESQIAEKKEMIELKNTKLCKNTKNAHMANRF